MAQRAEIAPEQWPKFSVTGEAKQEENNYGNFSSGNQSSNRRSRSAKMHRENRKLLHTPKSWFYLVEKLWQQHYYKMWLLGEHQQATAWAVFLSKSHMVPKERIVCGSTCCLKITKNVSFPKVNIFLEIRSRNRPQICHTH